MDKSEMLRRMRSGNFSDNNGAIMRLLNYSGNEYKYVRLSEIRHGVYELNDAEFLASVNYLAGESYISVRDIVHRQQAEVCDFSVSDLEIKVTTKGTRLHKGYITDETVSV